MLPSPSSLMETWLYSGASASLAVAVFSLISFYYWAQRWGRCLCSSSLSHPDHFSFSLTISSFVVCIIKLYHSLPFFVAVISQSAVYFSHSILLLLKILDVLSISTLFLSSFFVISISMQMIWSLTSCSFLSASTSTAMVPQRYSNHK